MGNILKKDTYNSPLKMEDNELQKLLQKYPNKPWYWFYLSYNPNITLEFVEKYLYKPWDWVGLSYNTNVTMEFVEKYPNHP